MLLLVREEYEENVRVRIKIRGIILVLFVVRDVIVESLLKIDEVFVRVL